VRFKELECVQYFLEYILPDMLSEKFIPHSELKEQTQRLIQDGDE
jgi:putative hydrolases of HD superfamily